MAMSLNRAQIIGNLTRDPELRQIPGGQTVASFSVATNFVWTDGNGQRQEKVEYHNIVAWRKLAEIVGQYVRKGSKVYVEGRMQTREWDGQDGVKRYKTEIIADNVIMLDRKGMAEGGMAGMPMGNKNLGTGPRTVGAQERDINPDIASAAAVASVAASNMGGDDIGSTKNVQPATEDEVTIEDLPF